MEEYNARFAVEPADPHSAFVPLEQGQSLDLILCYREKRSLGTGETISYNGQTYTMEHPDSKQIIPPKTRLEVRKTLDGKLFVWYKGKAYPLVKTAKPERKASASKEKAGSERKPHKPAANHPWRQYKQTPLTSRIPQRDEKVEQKQSKG